MIKHHRDENIQRAPEPLPAHPRSSCVPLFQACAPSDPPRVPAPRGIVRNNFCCEVSNINLNLQLQNEGFGKQTKVKQARFLRSQSRDERAPARGIALTSYIFCKSKGSCIPQSQNQAQRAPSEVDKAAARSQKQNAHVMGPDGATQAETAD